MERSIHITDGWRFLLARTRVSPRPIFPLFSNTLKHKTSYCLVAGSHLANLPGPFVDTLATEFPTTISNASQVPSAVEVYRKVLSEQPDNRCSSLSIPTAPFAFRSWSMETLPNVALYALFCNSPSSRCSVVIVSIGFFTNLYDLMQSPAGQYLFFALTNCRRLLFCCDVFADYP